MKFTNEELKGILQKHEKWLRGAESGERANLAVANLRSANLRSANLAGANLAGANLAGANLADANLADADLDYSTLYFSCKTLSTKFSNRITVQILYHAAMPAQRNALDLDDDVKALFNSELFKTVVNKFHRVEECGAFTGCKEKERAL